MNTTTKFVLIVIALMVLFVRAQQLNVAVLNTDPTRITYLYDDVEPSRQIQYLLTEITKKGKILAAHVPIDARTGTGEFPQQYAVAKDAAESVGVPCLVLQANDKVISTETDPPKILQVLNGFHQSTN